jgi:hypothetical protein
MKHLPDIYAIVAFAMLSVVIAYAQTDSNATKHRESGAGRTGTTLVTRSLSSRCPELVRTTCVSGWLMVNFSGMTTR